VRRRKQVERREGAPRLLVPFAGGHLDSTVLDAALRIARAEEAVLVPAYLILVPMEFTLDAALKREVEVAMPLLDAVEQAALRARVPVDARIERGRTLRDALRQLWEIEPFDRILVPAGDASGHIGFTVDDLAWILAHSPTETLVLKPAPTNDAGQEGDT
jgi:hypothetical protein